MREDLEKIENDINSALYSIRSEIEDLEACVEKFQNIQNEEIKSAWDVLILHGIIPGARFRINIDETHKTYKVVGISPDSSISAGGNFA